MLPFTVPIYFHFIHRETGESVAPDDIDDELRMSLNLPPNAEDYCSQFWMLLALGEFSTTRTKQFNEEDFKYAVDLYKIPLLPTLVIRHLLQTKYHYCGWR